MLISNIAVAKNAQSDAPLDALTNQREAFATAWALLEKNDPAWQAIANDLNGYPLQMELEIESRRRSADLPESTVANRFLERAARHQSGQRLRQKWLSESAKKGRYSDVITWYRPGDSVTAQCHYQYALIKNGQPNRDASVKLYLSGRSQPDACDPLFDEIKQRGWIDAGVIRMRKDLAIKAGQIGLAKNLAKRLGPKNETRVQHWILARSNPERYLADFPNGEFVAIAAERLIIREPDAIEPYWAQIKVDAVTLTGLRETQALHAALDKNPRTPDYFQRLARPLTSPTLAAWEARYFLGLGDAQRALVAISHIPADILASDRWQYWKAIALTDLGRTVEAQAILQRIARNNSYYGFLAADQMGSPYLIPSDTPVKIRSQDELMGQQELLIARELFVQNLPGRARSQWRAAWPKLNQSQKKSATALALSWGWASEAIRGAFATGKTGLNFRYPTTLASNIQTHARDGDADLAWVLGLMRSESLFMSDVSSRVGALGLMQIMPKTGERVAQQLSTPWRGKAMLLEPDVNIRFGVHYLNQMLERFDANQLMATAAYNAGPHRVEDWQPTQGSVDPRIWVETIPYKETRGYVQKVMHAAVLYEQQVGGQTARLSDRMRPILAKAE